MGYFIFFFVSSLILLFATTTTNASVSKSSQNSENVETMRITLESINGTNNFRMHGKKSKDDRWVWDGKEGRYIYCVREAINPCEKLEIKQCFGQNIPYQSTNQDLTHFFSQDVALERITSYQALKHVPKCWAVIQPLLCAVLFPKCEKIIDKDMIYLPSLEMCKITMEPCKILYNTSYFPDFLKCNESNFPTKCHNDVREMKFNLTGQCLHPLVPTMDPTNSYKDIEGCGLECKDPLYTDDEHRQIRKQIGWCASVSLVLHLFAIFTFTVDWHNGNKYPGLIIFYVNLCYMISCIGWLAQFIPGARQDIACRFDNTLKQGEPSGGENLSCIIVFILVYYFLMAAMCWFVIFTYAWYMSFKAIGKIQERIDKKASYFHVISWSIPLVLTITVLAISEVDANSTVGICFVGYVNHPIRGGFVLGPVLCSLLIGGYFLVRGIVILVNLKISSKQIISTKANKKIRQSIVRMCACSTLVFVFIIITILCHIYEFKNSTKWATSLRDSIICKITSIYSDDSSSCKIVDRPSISILQLHLLALFASGMVMASFVFTPSSLEIWSRYFRRKFGKKVEEPLKLQKHKVIAQAFAKRKDFQNRGRLSISFHNSHTDPVGLKIGMSDMNSTVGSHDFSTTWANNLPRIVNRRCALTGCPSSSRSSHGHRKNSVDSEISFSYRHVSVESRRNSNDSQVSVKIAEMKTKVASRSRGSKSKSRSSRHQRRDFTSRRYSRKESSTSMESQILAIAQKGAHSTSTAEANAGMLVPVSHRRRSGIADLSREQINELVAKNRFLLPYLTTSEDDKSSVGSFIQQDSKIDAILKQIGMSEHQIIENKLNNDNLDGDSEEIQVMRKSMNEYSDVSGKENMSRAIKASNRSINSKKALKASCSSRTRKGRKSSRSITRNANPLSITNGSGKMKLEKKMEKERKSKDILRKSQEETFMAIEMMPINDTLQGSCSGRSDIGIQTEMGEVHTISSMEFAENLMKQDRENNQHDEDIIDDDEDDPTENFKLLPKKTSINHTTKKRDTNEISLTESEKLKLLLLPSK